jgi:glycine betaine/choline ABC-type transport system substrate-binding protein
VYPTTRSLKRGCAAGPALAAGLALAACGTSASGSPLTPTASKSSVVVGSANFPEDELVAQSYATALAARHHLSSIAQLKPLAASIVFGAPPEFKTRADGQAGLRKRYGTIVNTLNAISARLTTAGLLDMDKAIILDHANYSTVAIAWLKAEGLPF